MFLDIASRLPAEEIKRRLPSMYHQFKELADVDITAQPMEVGPTCHYVMGGVEVDPDTASSTVPGLFAAGEVAGGMHGSNRLGGNSLSDLIVFGRRAGLGAVEYVDGARRSARRSPSPMWTRRRRGRRSPFDWPDERAGGEPVHDPLRAAAVDERPGRHHPQGGGDPAGAGQARRAQGSGRSNVAVEGRREFNPGWHLALDLRNMLLVSECVAKAALMRTESRGGHTRDDFPGMDAQVAQQAAGLRGRRATARRSRRRSRCRCAQDLLELFELAELEKYYTDGELAAHPERRLK